MGWIISLCLFVYACLAKNNDPMLFIASGLFAIGGCIGGLAGILKDKK